MKDSFKVGSKIVANTTHHRHSYIKNRRVDTSIERNVVYEVETLYNSPYIPEALALIKLKGIEDWWDQDCFNLLEAVVISDDLD